MFRVGNRSSNQSGSACRSPLVRLVVPLLLAVLITGCGGASNSGVQEDRRFATDPEPVPTDIPATVTPAPTPTEPLPLHTVASASPEATHAPARSIVSYVYSLIAGEIMVVDPGSGVSRVIAKSTETRSFELIVPLPDGSATGAIARSGPDKPWELLLITADGDFTTIQTDLTAVLGPGGTGLDGRLAASWSPDGEQLAIVFPDGGGVVARLDGATRLLLTRGQAPAPIDVAWSPDGEVIAFTSRDLDDPSPYLAIGGSRVFPLDPVRVAGTGGQRPIHRIAWAPDSERLLVVQGAAGQADGIGGDVIEIDRRTLAGRFAVGGSRFGPGARVVVTEPSPGGEWWAVVTVAPGPTGGLEATVWQTAGNFADAIRLELGENPPVAGVIWTRGGLTVLLHASETLVTVTFDAAGSPITPGTPEASPAPVEASPVAPPIVETATPAETVAD